MEHQKKLDILNEANDSKFVTRKWNTDNDNSKAIFISIKISYTLLQTKLQSAKTTKYKLKKKHI